jgi:DNA mismatch repair protein MutL
MAPVPAALQPVSSAPAPGPSAAASRAGTRAPIRPLPSLLVNQIAAGEVVERPASAVKELIDNALDAGATRIRVELEQGGIELLRVSDDGGGIPADQLPLAIAPHATSKIREAADLDRIATMGFRGEALASIASVARLEIRSRTSDSPAAAVIRVEGDQAGVPAPAAGPIGTSVTVRNLFFNTPARRKFLKTPATEQGRCLDVVRDAALSHPALGFTAIADGRVVLDVAPGQSPRARALAVLGKELEAELIEVHADAFDDARGLAMWGLIGRPSIARATAQAQHVFLNGRVIRDKTIQHAIKEAYRGLIEPGRHPTAVLMLEMDPGAVDVNVHPAKTEVRFRDASLVHRVVYRAIRDQLRAHDLVPSFASSGVRPEVLGIGGEGASAAGFGATGILPSGPWPGTIEARPAPSVPLAERVRAFVDAFKAAPAPSPTLADVSNAPAAADAPNAATLPAPAGSLPSPLTMPTPAERVLQVHKSYLVTQDAQGVVIIDQHALHERIMFEALLDRLAQGGGRLESQRLLTPAVVRASPERIERLLALGSGGGKGVGGGAGLERLGIELAAMGPEAVALQAFPSFLFERGVEAGAFLEALLERLDEEDGLSTARGASTKGPRDNDLGERLMHEVLDMMACKAAVKAGDRLTDDELLELVRLREDVERSTSCPHGRPTAIRLTIKELEKLFHRA